VTPADNVLQGVTRKKILNLASRNYKTELRPVRLEEMKEAAELFITSTTGGSHPLPGWMIFL
jgi:branched-subunit amino acid aminotransferase/4-amino-4-deoxychorismate lyase